MFPTAFNPRFAASSVTGSQTRRTGKFATCATKAALLDGRSGARGALWSELEMALAGEHNALNATAAAALAFGCGIPQEPIRAALAGVQERETPA